MVEDNPVKPKKATTFSERKVAELILEASIFHNCKPPDGLMAIVDHYLELAKCHIHEGSCSLYDIISKYHIHLNIMEQQILVDDRMETMHKV